MGKVEFSELYFLLKHCFQELLCFNLFFKILEFIGLEKKYLQVALIAFYKHKHSRKKNLSSAMSQSRASDIQFKAYNILSPHPLYVVRQCMHNNVNAIYHIT